jgi:hypothetical protein
MKNCLIASANDGADEAFSHGSWSRPRVFVLIGVAVVLAHVFASQLAAQPSILLQPLSQTVWGGSAVAFSVDVIGGTASPLPAINSGKLQLWLRADTGVIITNGDYVSQWQDQSGNGNDAVQTSSNSQPLLVYPPGLGGRAAVRFEGVLNAADGDYLIGAGDVGVPNAMTAFTVYNAFSNVIGATDWGAVLWFVGSPAGSASSRGCAIFHGLLDFTTWDGNELTPFIVPTNTYRICTDRLNGDLSTVEIFDNSANSATNFSFVMTGQAAPAAGYYVGALDPSVASYYNGRCFDGDIAELMIYQGYLSDADRVGVLGYLQDKYFYSVPAGDAAYQWRFDGINIPGATNATLVLADVQATNEGSYSAVVTDLAGSTTSSNAVLEVNLMPIILAQPTNPPTVYSFQSVTLSVDAQGPLPLQYQWTFDGVDVDGATNSALVFSITPPSAAGTYAVIVGTEPDVVVSSNAVVSVYPPNEVISNLNAGELNTALLAGGTVTFATSGTIVLTNTITLSNNVILDGTNHSITISGGGAVEIFNLPSGLSLTLHNLTLANGLQNGDFVNFAGITYPGTGQGGAIFAQGNLDIENCTFANNGVISPSVPFSDGGSTQGGAIYNTGTMTISNTLFVSNLVVGGGGGAEDTSTAGSGFGGAIYNSGGAVSLSNVTFSNNAAVGGTGIPAVYGGYAGRAYGGALFSSGGNVWANNAQVINNTASGGDGSGGEPPFVFPNSGGAAQGGAFYLTGTTAAISNSVFSNNVALGGSGYDAAGGIATGGIIVNTGACLIWHCDLESSLARGATGSSLGGDFQTGAAGGAIYNTGALQLIGSAISSCSANGWAGGLFNTGFVQMSNAILSSNLSYGPNDYGYAIYSTGVIQLDSNSTLIPYVTGTPPLTYQWQDNGGNIVGSTNSILDLGSVAFAYAGTYDLVISHATGLVTNFEEIVNEPPPLLSISSVSPDIGLTNGGLSVTINGTGFTNGVTVFFGNAAATSVTVVSPTNITAYTPAVTTAGAVNVVVINADFQPVVLPNGFTFVAPVSISSPQQSGTLGSGNNGTFTLTVGGAALPGWNFVIECSTDLVNWEPLQTNSSPFTFTDTNAASYALRFYRAVQTP